MEILGELVGVHRGGHEDEAEVRPRREDVLADCHQEIRMNISFMYLKKTNCYVSSEPIVNSENKTERLVYTNLV